MKLKISIFAIASSILAFLAGVVPALSQTDGYRLSPGDILQVEVLEDPSLSRSTLVLPNGSVTFPQAGTIRAGGRTPDQVRAALTTALAPGFAAPPTVYVSVASVGLLGAEQAADRTIDVYVLGEVGAPGLKEVKPNTNVLQFLSQAGALSKFAAEHRIELHRRDPQTGAARIWLFDLDHVGGSENRISGLTRLAEGDVLLVPQRKLFE